MSIKKDWKLPKPPKKKEMVWHQVVRVGRYIPFGYLQNETDPDILDPVPSELELLELAKEHLKKYSYREVANWLSAESGRTISHEGLRKRVQIESKRKIAVANSRVYAERAQAAAEKAKKIESRIGGKTFETIDHS